MATNRIPTYDLIYGNPPKNVAWTKGLPQPYCYERDPEDEENVILNDFYLKCMRKVIEYIDRGCSYRDAANWITVATGKKITREAIFYIHKKLLAEVKAKREEKRFNTLNQTKIKKILDATKQASAASAAKKQAEDQEFGDESRENTF